MKNVIESKSPVISSSRANPGRCLSALRDRQRGRRFFLSVALCLCVFVLLSAGCASFRTCTVPAEHRRPGKVFIMRGVFNVFSLGLDTLAAKLRANGVDARICAYGSWPFLADYIIYLRQVEGDMEPIVLVGHSTGVDDIVWVAKRLDKEDIEVDLLVSLEDFISPKVPRNVRRVFNIHKRPSRLSMEPPGPGSNGRVEFIDFNLAKHKEVFPNFWLINHLNIEGNGAVHEVIIEEICRLLPATREEHLDTP